MLIKTLICLVFDVLLFALFRIYFDIVLVLVIDYYVDGNVFVCLMNDTGHLVN